jgi:hypothetical protein
MRRRRKSWRVAVALERDMNLALLALGHVVAVLALTADHHARRSAHVPIVYLSYFRTVETTFDEPRKSTVMKLHGFQCGSDPVFTPMHPYFRKPKTTLDPGFSITITIS